MSFQPFNVDLTGATTWENSGPLPAGVYEAQITSVELEKKERDGTVRYDLKFGHTITGGKTNEANGREFRLWVTVPGTGDTDKQNAYKSKFRTLYESIGYDGAQLGQFQVSPDHFAGQKVHVLVRERGADQKYADIEHITKAKYLAVLNGQATIDISPTRGSNPGNAFPAGVSMTPPAAGFAPAPAAAPAAAPAMGAAPLGPPPATAPAPGMAAPSAPGMAAPAAPTMAAPVNGAPATQPGAVPGAMQALLGAPQ